jgi:geranylgeranyl diphosphate synthase type I
VSAPLRQLDPYKTAIEAELERFLDRAPGLFGIDASEQGRKALGQLHEYCLRPGKRIRGTLAALAYDTAAGTDKATQGLQLAVVLELLQAYLLIIDDVMDRSTMRRGKPTLHELYRIEVGDRHAADMLAINVGCLAQHLANMCLAGIAVPAEQRQRAMSIIHRNIGITGLGQLDDMYQSVGRIISEESVLAKYRHKSSYYTFVNPLQSGFVLAGEADEAIMEAIAAFGIPAGIAFQLHDDYLGIWGDTDKHGKSNLDDIREGKYTMLVQYALSHASPYQEEQLSSILGNEAAGEQELLVVQQVFSESGAKKYCQEQVTTHVAEAEAALKKRPFGSESLSALLQDLLEYAVMRET